MVIAHKNQETDEEQLLSDHLLNTAYFSAENGSAIKQKKILFLIGLLHDLGKADRQFQKKIKEKPRMKVMHASAGAKYLLKLIASSSDENLKQIQLNNRILFKEYLEVIAYVITAHHGLYDIWLKESNDNQLLQRLQYDNDGEYYFEEDVVPFAEAFFEENEIDIVQMISDSFAEFKILSERLIFDNENNIEKEFYSGLKVRLYLSFLKNADITDSINAYTNVVTPLNSQEKLDKKTYYIKEIEKKYNSFSSPETDIDRIRNRLAIEAKDRGKADISGIYQLNLPTGAGKTLVSLRYALHQLKFQEKEKVFYITPFLSVLEQNAKEIKNILKDKHITEHHSNIVSDKSSKEENGIDDDFEEDILSQYLVDSWDSPVILSTMVQFFQTLFKGKANNIRRFSSLSNSVIILDEVQSLPIEVIHLFNMTMNFISQAMGSTIVLCTATQPKYDSEFIDYPIRYNQNNDKNIVSMSSEERSFFERTEVRKLNNGENSSADEIVEETLAHPNDSMLIILNTKNAVRSVVDELEHLTNRQVFYLSTNLCPKHRQDIIDKIKQLLPEEPLICVSTQLIEAGVDLDFNRLIRSYAGIDSIVQAMGRCNRNGEMEGKGSVKLVKTKQDFENVNVSALKSIQDKVTATETILRDENEPLNLLNVNDKFYEYYYANQSEKLNYPLGKDQGSGVSLLSSNRQLVARNNNKYLKQSFKTAAQKIDLINQETTGVIVYYKDKNRELVEELIQSLERYEYEYQFDEIDHIKSQLNLLQPYTVNMHSMDKIDSAVMSYMDGQVNILTEDYYDNNLGVIENIDYLIT